MGIPQVETWREAEALFAHGGQEHQELEQPPGQHGPGADDGHGLIGGGPLALDDTQGGPAEADEAQVPEDRDRGRQGEAVAQVQQGREARREAHQGKVGEHDAAQEGREADLGLGAPAHEQGGQGAHEQQHQGHARQQDREQRAQEAGRRCPHGSLAFGGLHLGQGGQKGGGHGALGREAAQEVGQANRHVVGVGGRPSAQDVAEEEGLGEARQPAQQRHEGHHGGGAQQAGWVGLAHAPACEGPGRLGANGGPCWGPWREEWCIR